MASSAYQTRSDSESELDDYDLDLTHPLIGVTSNKHNHHNHWSRRLLRAARNTLPLPFSTRRSPLIGRHGRARSPLRLRPHSVRHFGFDIVRFLALGAGIFVLLSVLNAVLWPSYMIAPAHYRQLEDRIQTSSAGGRGNPNNEKVYIAANIIHEDLIRETWGSNLLELINILGSDNVFVSIYENDSGNGTRDALLDLQKRLPCTYLFLLLTLTLSRQPCCPQSIH
jgi:hypothetical protein